MNGTFRFDVPNMDSEDAKLGMRQAARDLKNGKLPTNQFLFPSRINAFLDQAIFPSAWMRGYLLIAFREGLLDRQAADWVARLLKRDHYLIDRLPDCWLKESVVKFPKATDLTRAALRYQTGQ
jgi:hypothetical protein